MGTCAIVGALDIAEAHFRAQHFDRVIAADGGFEQLLRMKAEPDVVVGDFDSLGFLPAGRDVRVHPAEKDESDMELACRVAIEEADRLVLYGCLGGRIDHSIANMQLLCGLAQQGARVWAIGRDCVLAALTSRAPLEFEAIPAEALNGPYRNFISVFAHGGTARGVVARGLKYVLRGEDLPDATSRGLSNEFTGTPASISLEQGTLLATFPLEAWPYLRT